MASGALIGALAFIPLYDKPNYPLRGLIATLAISLLGAQGLLWVFGPRVKALPKIFGVGTFKFGTVVASYDKIGTIVSAAVLLLAVLVWMKTSRRGLEIRAMMQNPGGRGAGRRRTAVDRVFRHDGHGRPRGPGRGAAVAELFREPLQRHDAARQRHGRGAGRRAWQHLRGADRGGSGGLWSRR